MCGLWSCQNPLRKKYELSILHFFIKQEDIYDFREQNITKKTLIESALAEMREVQGNVR